MQSRARNAPSPITTLLIRRNPVGLRSLFEHVSWGDGPAWLPTRLLSEIFKAQSRDLRVVRMRLSLSLRAREALTKCVTNRGNDKDDFSVYKATWLPVSPQSCRKVLTDKMALLLSFWFQSLLACGLISASVFAQGSKASGSVLEYTHCGRIMMSSLYFQISPSSSKSILHQCSYQSMKPLTSRVKQCAALLDA